jgi:RNA polymerase sigma-70 factor, ECF subfamily
MARAIRFDGRSAFRSWLYRITVNACLDVIARRPKRVLPVEYEAPDVAGHCERRPDAIRVEPYPDALLRFEEGSQSAEERYALREGAQLAFVAALQHLPPRQRAVLVLREVLGFSAKEVSHALETTAASVNSCLLRARRTVDQRLPEKRQQGTLRMLENEHVRKSAERFVSALERGDVDAILTLLGGRATLAIRPNREFVIASRKRSALATVYPLRGRSAAAEMIDKAQSPKAA